jgi:hypothetical protein
MRRRITQQRKRSHRRHGETKFVCFENQCFGNRQNPSRYIRAAPAGWFQNSSGSAGRKLQRNRCLPVVSTFRPVSNSRLLDGGAEIRERARPNLKEEDLIRIGVVETHARMTRNPHP